MPHTYDLGGNTLRVESLYTGAMHPGEAGTLMVAGTESALLTDITPGTVAASKAVVVDASNDIAGLNNVTQTGTLTVGVDGTGADVEFYGATIGKSWLWDEAADKMTVTGDVDIVGSVNFTGETDFNGDVEITGGLEVVGALSATSVNSGGQIISNSAWVDGFMTFAQLAASGTVAVADGTGTNQYKIRDIRIVGGGVGYGADGDRNISLTDGTTIWTTIDNADVEAPPAATLSWGNAKVPFLTGTSATASVAGQNVRWVYSGGTTDHTATGNIEFSVLIEKIA